MNLGPEENRTPDLHVVNVTSYHSTTSPISLSQIRPLLHPCYGIPLLPPSVSVPESCTWRLDGPRPASSPLISLLLWHFQWQLNDASPLQAFSRPRHKS